MVSNDKITDEEPIIKHVILQTARIYSKATGKKYLAGGLQSGFTASFTGVQYKCYIPKYSRPQFVRKDWRNSLRM